MRGVVVVGLALSSTFGLATCAANSIDEFSKARLLSRCSVVLGNSDTGDVPPVGSQFTAGEWSTSEGLVWGFASVEDSTVWNFRECLVLEGSG